MIDYRTDYYKGLARLYFNRILKTIVRLGELQTEQGLILDFGCGHQHLKGVLRSKNLVGYDILPELSDVRDYKTLKPSVIVCNNILEHFTSQHIRETIRTFLRMNPSVRLVTATPTENWVSRIGMLFTGLNNAHDDHQSSLSVVHSTLREYFELVARKRLFTICEVAVWKARVVQ